MTALTPVMEPVIEEVIEAGDQAIHPTSSKW
jgi:hypothetical protein